MELEELIKNLQEYIDLDRKMRTSPIEEWSDFDKFCELHCRDIEKALKYIKEESIPKAVVEAEIHDVDNWLDDGRYMHYGLNPYELKAQKEILQEILNKGE